MMRDGIVFESTIKKQMSAPLKLRRPNFVTNNCSADFQHLAAANTD
jgi:hypothetical protein